MFFKKNRQNSHALATRLKDILKKGPNNLHINIYVKNQILFQVMPAKNFVEKGLTAINPNDFVVAHFFNKNKTLTFDKLEKLNNPELSKDYMFYEEPKGNLIYLKIIGQNPIEIEKEIYANFKEVYELEDLLEVTIDFIDY
jgi:hypothetical protein